MLLYHISTNMLHDGTFMPRIPENRLENECTRTKRICFSKTLEGCFSAMPGGGGRLEELNMERYGCYRLLVVDTEEAGLLAEDMLMPEELYDRGLVDDAEETQEVWVLKPVQATASHAVFLSDWQERPYDAFPKEVLALCDSKYDGDVEAAYFDLVPDHDGFIPSVVMIENVELSIDTLKAGDTVYNVPIRIEGVEELLAELPGVDVSFDQKYDSFEVLEGEVSIERFWKLVCEWS